ncbi:hypothetical protein K432DRAFT_377359 [Lepidopterella palustris CBS 459.81]|uniref:Heterokaryon incompatibility domain-containing protein n=1 Tax=Lepidopterella palustris CBS 459.81 TaxID=1314670 RepID=A0A8E2EKZ2_9PEZI|nr:hypothetical protein K432DRAFT_377359 [Lepidopterella palustris CBS 459.81]
MFWADAICINQSGLRERSSEVRLTNTIYRSAERVAVWPCDPDNIYSPTGDSLDQAFDWTIVANVGSANPQAGNELSRRYSINWALVNDIHAISAMSNEDVTKRANMLNDVKPAVFRGRFFWTRKSSMDIGQDASGIYDIVGVLFGGLVLYVLRAKNSERHEFIGEFYIHGMVDGETVEGCDTDRGLQSRTVVIVERMHFVASIITFQWGATCISVSLLVDIRPI